MGGALQVKSPDPADQHKISGHIFAQWLSIAYMTFAQASSPVLPIPLLSRSQVLAEGPRIILRGLALRCLHLALP